MLSKDLDKLLLLTEKIRDDMDAAGGGNKSACRRIRVALSEISKLCKSSRKEVLAKMKE